MRLFEFEDILKQFDAYVDVLPPDVIKFVKEHCSDFLKDAKQAGEFLYHGDSTKSENIFLAKTKEGRRTLNTRSDLQVNFDDAARRQGFTALRSNSLFCVSDKIFAGTYGKVYMVFPLNGFSYTWSPKISDFYNKFYGIYNRPVNVDWDKFIVDNSYTNTDMVTALKSIEKEILINGQFVAMWIVYFQEAKRAFL